MATFYKYYIAKKSNDEKDVTYIKFDTTDISYRDIKSNESLLTKEEYNI